MNAKRYFNWEEATALLPRLTDIFAVVRQLRAQLRSTYEQLERLGSAPTPENLNQTGTPEVTRLRAAFRGLYETLAEQLHEIEELGAHVKDIDSGLVDFLYRREGRDVFLCWRYGEPAITHWHDLEAGFRGRRPLEEEDRKAKRVLH